MEYTIYLTGAPPTFSLGSFFPTELNFTAEFATSDSVIALCAMDNGNILVGAGMGGLEIRDECMNVLSKCDIAGHLVDIAVLWNAPLSLVREKDELVINYHTNELRDSKRLYAWKTGISGGECVATYGRQIVVTMRGYHLALFMDVGGSIFEKHIWDSKFDSLCMTNADSCFATSETGITQLTRQLNFLWCSWDELGSNTSMYQDEWPTPQSVEEDLAKNIKFLMTSFSNADESGLLSKTTDASGFVYAYRGGKVMAFKEHGKFF